MARARNSPVMREELLCALGNTYDDSKFLVGIAMLTTDSFFNGLCHRKHEFWSKEQLLAAIADSELTQFPGITGHEDDLIISNHLSVWRRSINRSQILPVTEDIGGFTHVHEKGNPHYDIYFKFNHEEKTVTFALGGKRKTIPVKEHTEWSWKPTRNGILCMDSEKLERDFLDEFWNPIAVSIGRKVLGIKDAV